MKIDQYHARILSRVISDHSIKPYIRMHDIKLQNSYSIHTPSQNSHRCHVWKTGTVYFWLPLSKSTLIWQQKQHFFAEPRKTRSFKVFCCLGYLFYLWNLRVKMKWRSFELQYGGRGLIIHGQLFIHTRAPIPYAKRSTAGITMTFSKICLIYLSGVEV